MSTKNRHLTTTDLRNPTEKSGLKAPPKVNRLNPGDEAIREIIIDIKILPKTRMHVNHYEALKHINPCRMVIMVRKPHHDRSQVSELTKT